MTDANWGPQDQSKPRENETRQLELFKSRSISGFVLWLNGPIHWASKRQSITARSSAEAEVYAVDECTKYLLLLTKIVDGWNLKQSLMPNQLKYTMTTKQQYAGVRIHLPRDSDIFRSEKTLYENQFKMVL